MMKGIINDPWTDSYLFAKDFKVLDKSLIL